MRKLLVESATRARRTAVRHARVAVVTALACGMTALATAGPIVSINPYVGSTATLGAPMPDLAELARAESQYRQAYRDLFGRDVDLAAPGTIGELGDVLRQWQLTGAFDIPALVRQMLLPRLGIRGHNESPSAGSGSGGGSSDGGSGHGGTPVVWQPAAQGGSHGNDSAGNGTGESGGTTPGGNPRGQDAADGGNTNGGGNGTTGTGGNGGNGGTGTNGGGNGDTGSVIEGSDVSGGTSGQIGGDGIAPPLPDGGHSPAPTPEPSTLILVGTAAAGLWQAHRRWASRQGGRR